MSSFQDVKAEPPAASRPQQSSKWPRTIKTISVVLAALLILGTVGSFHHTVDNFRLAWSWNHDGGSDRGHILRGDQYLLGVGKADITGWLSLFIIFKHVSY